MTDPIARTPTSDADAPGGRLRAAAALLASLVIPLPVVAGRVVEAVLDTLNPADTDVTAGLAYLREILGTAFGALGLLLVIIVVVFVLVGRRSGARALRLPLLILVVELVLGAIALAANALIQSAEG